MTFLKYADMLCSIQGVVLPMFDVGVSKTERDTQMIKSNYGVLALDAGFAAKYPTAQFESKIFLK